MASSRKSSRSKPASTDLAGVVAAQLARVVGPRDRLTVGLSGGVDSVVLLDCLRRAARPLGLRVSALHVNHQLSPNAGGWSSFCRKLCAARGVPFSSVKVRLKRGRGVEAEARAARYDAFSRHSCDYIVLAHHRDDQVETLLLQLLRGAGVKGLAAMPLLRKPEAGSRKSKGESLVTRHPSPGVLRPLLNVTRDEILEYAKRHKLKWIEDESNRDLHFRRNFLRHDVLPRLAGHFPAWRTTLARSAGHLAEAAAVLDEVAAADGARFRKGGTLAVEALKRLPPARARNLLRHFLDRHGRAMPATEHLAEALRQLMSAKRDAGVAIRLDGATLMRHEGRVHVVRAGNIPRDFRRRWRGERQWAFPELEGVLTLKPGKGKGISLSRLRDQVVTVRLRQGGERLKPDRRRPRRSLKKLLQEAGLPPWRRERLPLLFCGESLVWVPGIGIDEAFQASRGEPAALPAWSPSAAV
jgi:tRNA(Ile)-lysidine synthase